MDTAEQTFQARITKIQKRPFWSFAIELQADHFATLALGSQVRVKLGWLLVSSVRIAQDKVRVRGCGPCRIQAGDQIAVQVRSAS